VQRDVLQMRYPGKDSDNTSGKKQQPRRIARNPPTVHANVPRHGSEELASSSSHSIALRSKAALGQSPDS